jgi:hypothetical protein
MITRSVLRSALFALSGLAFSIPAFATGNCANGKTLYATPVSGLSCSSSSCHKADPSSGTNKILNGANNPTKIANAINSGVPEMAIFKGKFTASDLDDLATWIAAAPTCPSGGTAVVGASPASFTFPSAQTVGSTSGPTTITVSNTGTASATSVSVSNSNASEFPASNTCGTTLANGSSCTISVSFAPAAAGSRSSTLTISSSAGTTTVGLSGTGAPAATPGVLSIPGPFAFTAQTVGSASAPQSFSLTNTGGTAVTISSVASSNTAEFAIGGSTCTGSIAPAASCSFSVTFTPSAAGARASSITVTSSGTGSPQSISVTGSGTAVATPGQLSMSASLGFGSQVVGTTSAVNSITITNVGGTAVAVSGVTSSNPAEFAIASTNCATVGAGAGCTVSVTFTPSAAGARSATITVVSNGTGSPQTITATGTGSATATPGQLSMSSPLSFGSQMVGTTSAVNSITITNVGGTAVTVSGVTSSNPAEFAIASTNCTTVNAGAGCTISVTFTPSAAGARSATITVVSNGVGSPQTITATGTGSGGSSSGQIAMPASVSAGNQAVGTTSAGISVTITNGGGTAVTVSGISSSNPSEFAVTLTNCGTLAPGAACSFSFTFTPGATGARSGAITITSNGTGSPQAIAVSGTGTAGAAGPTAGTVTVVEYHHQWFDHYFITAAPTEISALDGGAFGGAWVRTGHTFKAFSAPGANTASVCRFFTAPMIPMSSHFYTPYAFECNTVKSNPHWLFEDQNMVMAMPDSNGNCATGYTPVYRFFNNFQGGSPNHRYTTDANVKAQMLAKGHIQEGPMPGMAFMCSPP